MNKCMNESLRWAGKKIVYQRFVELIPLLVIPLRNRFFFFFLPFSSFYVCCLFLISLLPNAKKNDLGRDFILKPFCHDADNLGPRFLSPWTCCTMILGTRFLSPWTCTVALWIWRPRFLSPWTCSTMNVGPWLLLPWTCGTMNLGPQFLSPGSPRLGPVALWNCGHIFVTLDL